MKFYQDSTIKDQKNQMQFRSTSTINFPKFVQPYRNIPIISHTSSVYDYYIQLLHLSTLLTQELLKNVELVKAHDDIVLKQKQKQKIKKKQNSQKSTSQNKDNSQNQYNIINRMDNKQHYSSRTSEKKQKIKKKQSQSEQQYKPYDDQSNQFLSNQVSESKNIPKNYGKAIINFILKNQMFANRIFQHFNIDKQQFLNMLSHLKHNLNTIRQLRSMWLQEQNKYAKLMRIFSMQYLRKYSLNYIFNSRIQNCKKHIKYRNKIIQSVKDPRNFTFMKQF